MHLNSIQKRKLIDSEKYKLIVDWSITFCEFSTKFQKSEILNSEYQFPYINEKIKFGILSDLLWIYKSLHDIGRHSRNLKHMQEFVAKIVFTIEVLSSLASSLNLLVFPCSTKESLIPFNIILL